MPDITPGKDQISALPFSRMPLTSRQPAIIITIQPSFFRVIFSLKITAENSITTAGVRHSSTAVSDNGTLVTDSLKKYSYLLSPVSRHTQISIYP